MKQNLKKYFKYNKNRLSTHTELTESKPNQQKQKLRVSTTLKMD